jgi:antitoxin (DNA-binding transcriptional repressor) of toxin-antitoxin stability system
LKFKSQLAGMKTISVREMKANWSAVEAQVREGETFEVVNRGRPSVRISPALPRKILVWEDHLETAIPDAGRSAEETVAADREGRW